MNGQQTERARKYESTKELDVIGEKTPFKHSHRKNVAMCTQVYSSLKQLPEQLPPQPRAELQSNAQKLEPIRRATASKLPYLTNYEVTNAQYIPVANNTATLKQTLNKIPVTIKMPTPQMPVQNAKSQVLQQVQTQQRQAAEAQIFTPLRQDKPKRNPVIKLSQKNIKMAQMDKVEAKSPDKYLLQQPRLVELSSSPSTFAPQVQVAQKQTIQDTNIKCISKKRPQLVVKKSSKMLQRRTQSQKDLRESVGYCADRGHKVQQRVTSEVREGPGIQQNQK